MKLSFLCAMVLGFCLPAAELGAQDLVSLPVKKVELYKNGMGYFEHLGTVKGQQSVEIALPSSQLNDVLKSLTVLDLGKGQIAGVNYDSAAPLDRRLAELPIDLDSAPNLVDFWNQERIRANLQGLNQTPEEATLRQRYIRQLDSQENRLAAMNTERSKLDAARAAAQDQLDAMIQKLSLDKKL